MSRHPNRFILFLTLFLLGTAAPVWSQTSALVGGTLIDGFGGQPVQDSVILIDGDRISAVGTVDTLAVPDGVEVISTEGMTVLPGLWDMHVHLMINGHADYAHWDETYPEQFEDIIMPASALQLLKSGVTSARDLGAPLAESISIRERINAGDIPGPTLYVSGPFIQKTPYPGTEAFRWGVDNPRDAKAKVKRLADAGVDVIKLIDQDQLSMDELQAIVDEAHANDLMVVAHSHRPEEIRRGVAVGVDNFEHTGLSTAPEYPPDVIAVIRERTAQMNLGPLWWTPTIEGLFNYEYVRDNPEMLDKTDWHEGLTPEIIEDIQGSIQQPERLPYFQITPARSVTLETKFNQLKDAGVVMLIGTDSGIPMKFHSNSTWKELDIWVNRLGVEPMEAIRGATYWPAVAMGVDDDYGTISEGKYADIIAIDGDPLRYIALLQNVDLVVKHGQQIK